MSEALKRYQGVCFAVASLASSRSLPLLNLHVKKVKCHLIIFTATRVDDFKDRSDGNLAAVDLHPLGGFPHRAFDEKSGGDFHCDLDTWFYKWWCWRDTIPRPADLESAALPLSYSTNPALNIRS